jgi:uncharacterized protein
MLTGRIACLALWLAACSLDGGTLGRLEAEPRPGSSATGADAIATDAELDAFVARVVKDVDQSWVAEFQRRNKPYVLARPVSFSAQAPNSCAGVGLSSDPKCQDAQAVYIDLDFQRALQAQFGKDAAAPQSYAIAHAMGHHVQQVLGLDRKAAQLVAGRPVAAHSVELQLELQADCLAGVWARVTKSTGLLERGQVEQALRQASEIGTQRQLDKPRAQRSDLENFTYAIPRRRLYWFGKGFNSARVEDCDTFEAQ